MMLHLVQEPGTAVNVDSILRANAPSNAFFESVVSLPGLAINMAVGVVLAFVLQWHYRRYATTLSGKDQFARVFPFIALTTLLIITIVKSSLALSLGLVGALSIVRFRTPIKEPEELAYLFICIAVGLGLGASQTLPTVTAFTFILLIAALRSPHQGRADGKDIYLSIQWRDGAANSGERVATLNSVLGEHVARSDLRRVDARDGQLEANYFVEFARSDDLPRLLERLNRDFSGMAVTFIDQNRLPSS